MSTIFHLAPAERWHKWPAAQSYLPAEYSTDGFVHCTAEYDLMHHVANRFYRGTPGDFVMLVIDPDRLSAPLRWEAPVHPDRLAGSDAAAPLFPHIYGPIDRAAVIEVRPVRRAESGEFLGW